MSGDYDGIALRSVNYGEGNKLLDIFTKEKGKLTVIARKAREMKKSKGNITELFSRMNYNLFKGKEFYYLNTSNVIEPYTGIREDIDKISYASYIVEMTNAALENEEENEKLYLLLDKTFKFLSSGDVDLRLLTLSFQLKMISFIGYRPALRFFSENRQGPYFFSYETGELLSYPDSNQSDYKTEVDPNIIEIIIKLLFSKLEDLNEIQVEKNQLVKTENLIFNYIAFHIGKTNYKSLKMLKGLNLL